jgi:hypothetical protein
VLLFKKSKNDQGIFIIINSFHGCLIVSAQCSRLLLDYIGILSVCIDSTTVVTKYINCNGLLISLVLNLKEHKI